MISSVTNVFEKYYFAVLVMNYMESNTNVLEIS